MSTQRRATAYHEAGHAVVRWCYGLEFRLVTIRPDLVDGSLGHVAHAPDEPVDGYAVSLAAGQVAEIKFRRRLPRWGSEGDDEDIIEIALARGMAPDTAAAWGRYCILMSRDLVNQYWREIQAVAAALLERETLSYQDAVDVMLNGRMKPTDLREN